MRPDLSKYVAPTNGDGGLHGGYLHWVPGMSGLPVRSRMPLPLLRNDDVKEAKPAMDFHCGWFDLSVEADLVKFQIIMELIAIGWFKQWLRKDFEFPAEKRMIVWLEWLQRYNELPEHFVKSLNGR